MERPVGRLTAEVIARAPQGFNAVKDYEIDLRGLKLSTVENLAVTQNQFDAVDLCDNEIVKLDGFPPLRRLSTLLVHNNRVTRIGPTLAATLPRLETLGLANNRLSHLGDLEPLAAFPRLCRLDLTGNPVTSAPHYRLYLIAKLPKLKLLDFARVRDAERKAAGVHFGGEAGAARLAEQAAQSAARTQPGGGGAGAGPLGGGGRAAGGGGAPSTAQLLALKAAIAGAATLDEVQRLEKALAAGQLPGGGDGMES